jgi:polyisoprenoid-binding protein YceI
MRLLHFAALAVMVAIVPAAPALAAPSLDPAAVPAGHYEVDPLHVSVIVRVRHMGLSRYTMRFDKIAAAYDYDPANPLATRLTATIDAHSLDTGERDSSKRFADLFLNADAHPAITFVSTALTVTDGTHGTLAGSLTLNGVTKPLTLDVTYDGYEASLLGGKRMGFSAAGVVKRSAYGSTAMLGPVGDDVGIEIEAEFVRK